MSKSIESLNEAMQLAMKIRPKVGGFPVLAEILRQAGVLQNIWALPSCQSIYVMKDGDVVNQGAPLITGVVDIPKFNEEALIKALRTDQAGQSTFPEFLKSAWLAGVIRYDVDFEERHVTYYGSNGEFYVEDYPAVELPA